ncbi:hypothetical protein AG1IA_03148 [Rhizoctonia solani AG-1 IA]|uniref:Uncharacterized protein n=1 Tax=Thanatephorus cucumeris (strain AG1-IA) TaxID=983506 RepID=L8X2I9_THACA|nr:hypothetical protein AG1IA_03148 [Rhizoctonia solani AG-1 IA]
MYDRVQIRESGGEGGFLVAAHMVHVILSRFGCVFLTRMIVPCAGRQAWP